jgi:hypothetical protein
MTGQKQEPRLEISTARADSQPFARHAAVSKAENQPFAGYIGHGARLKISHLLRSTIVDYGDEG